MMSGVGHRLHASLQCLGRLYGIVYEYRLPAQY